ncbi:MAG TPA: hypothetical protein PKE29_13270 [Phycisphaerales bacterium]|nr:hypothetical protein [Phycisphaerales bacterium]
MRPRHTILTLAACCTLLAAAGCQIGQLFGGMAASHHRTGSTDFKAKYTGLTDKTFAVIVASDRSIQSDFPGIVPVITREVSKLLAEHAGAKGMLPANEVLQYQSQHPGWVARPFDELAKDLAVDRVVYIDLQEFALTDPGNIYVYNGAAAGVVHVIEAESPVASEFAFGEPVRVKYPDMSGMGPNQIPRQDVLNMLAKRFIDRAAWLLYDHEEPNAIKY